MRARAAVERPAILFLYDDSASLNPHVERHLTMAAEVGFRSFVADWSTLKVLGRWTTIGRGFEIDASGEKRALPKGAPVRPAVILHRTRSWQRSGALMGAVERANPKALLSFHPRWPELNTKWIAELCFRQGEAAGWQVARPTTYLVETSELSEQLQEVGSTTPLIFKPTDGAQCRGIVISTPATFQAVAVAVARSSSGRYVVQDLAPDPVLYHGKRFALRMYALVTSFRPLRYKLYREGLVKTAAYDYDPAAVTEAPRVLASLGYRRRLGVEVDDVAISELLPYLEGEGYRVGGFWDQADALVGNVFASLATYPPLEQSSGGKRRFFLTGMDLLMVRRDRTFGLLFLETNDVPTLFGREAKQEERVLAVHREWLTDLWQLCQAEPSGGTGGSPVRRAGGAPPIPPNQRQRR